MTIRLVSLMEYVCPDIVFFGGGVCHFLKDVVRWWSHSTGSTRGDGAKETGSVSPMVTWLVRG